MADSLVSFCNWYTLNIYPVICDALGHLTSKIPFAVGEIILYLAVIALIILLAALVILLFFRKKHQKLVALCFRYLKGCLITLAIFAFIYLFNWFIPLGSSLLDYSDEVQKNWNVEQVRALREAFVTAINQSCEMQERDDEGNQIYPDEEIVLKEVNRALSDLSGEYGRLSGYYPKPKASLCSGLLDAMDIGGYTYPYTMEVTYNRYITRLYAPSLIAHEECHHKGYYKENEAVFLGCLSCIRSDDAFIRYSGLLTAYGYLDNAYWDTLCKELGKEQAKAVYRLQPGLSSRVKDDLRVASGLARENYESDWHLPDKVLQSANEVSEVGWDTQDKLLAENSYDGAVVLFLDYFYNRNGGSDGDQ